VDGGGGSGGMLLTQWGNLRDRDGRCGEGGHQRVCWLGHPVPIDKPKGRGVAAGRRYESTKAPPTATIKTTDIGATMLMCLPGFRAHQ